MAPTATTTWPGRTEYSRLAGIDSPPLAELVRDINKYSNNVMARQLFLTLALESRGAPARVEQARAVVGEWLAGRGVAAGRSPPQRLPHRRVDVGLVLVREPGGGPLLERVRLFAMRVVEEGLADPQQVIVSLRSDPAISGSK